LFVRKPNKINFFALSLGSIIPDLEVPFLFLLIGRSWKSRWIMHSLLGAFSIDLLIVVIATIFIVPWVLSTLDKKLSNKRLFFFSGCDLREHKTSKTVIVYSGLIGTVSHVLIDLLHHPYNPVTFPFEEYYNFNLILFNNLFLANAIMQGVMAALLLIMIYYWYLKDLR
jgi:hypothetical protein